MTCGFSISVNKIHLYCILGAFVQISEINLIILDKNLFLGSMVEKNHPFTTEGHFPMLGTYFLIH